MELTQYLKIVRKWGWLMLLAAFLSGSVTFVVVSSQAATYNTSVIVRIGNAFENPDPNSSQISIARDLTEEYVQILRTFSVRQATIEALDLPFSEGQLGNLVSTRILPNTSLLVIEVRYTDPVLAADIANQLAEELRARSPNELTAQQQVQVDVANAQIQTLTDDIQALRAELDTITSQLAQAAQQDVDPLVIENLNTRRTQLIDQIIQTDANIAQYQSNIAQYNTRTNSATIIEPARIPQNPSGRNLLQVVVIAAVLSAGLAFGLVLAYEYVNDTIGTAEEATRVVGAPVVGVISRIGNARKDGYEGRLVSEQSLMSQTTEEYRTLRANLSFVVSNNEREEGTAIFMVTSGLPSEGKSLTTANLAITMALSGKRVVLIDADLRKPKQHDIFHVDSSRGLTSLLAATPLLDDEVDIYEVDEEDEEHNYADLEKVMFPTAVENLRLIPSGFLPQNPNEILGSLAMKRWIRVMRNAPGIDVILIDSPPCLAISDAPVMAANIEARVLLVLESERTRRRAAMRSKERFDNAGVGLLGLVLNGANVRSEDYYGYGYGSNYYLQLEPLNPSAPENNEGNGVRW